jgi:homoserine dehydrogenase
MKTVNIGLLGFGTVGAGVVDGLRRNGNLIAARLGVRPVIYRIADLDTTRDRGVPVEKGVLVSDAAGVIDDPNTQVVVELIGGTGAARACILSALKQGKPVVTANKALLAEHGAEIFGAANASGTDIYFGASVGGGIPIIRALREGLAGNRIERILGILNGTCNYILTRMEADGLPFEAALAEAQDKGYAEADPGLDIDGHDTAHKAAILASLAHGMIVPLDAVRVEGIRGLAKLDIRYAADLGYRIKLLAVVKRAGGALDVRVHPALVPLHHVLASVSGVFNAVMVRGDLAGDTLYYGRGAGREPTASTVIGDVVDIVRNLVSASPGRVPVVTTGPAEVVRDFSTRYYLRMTLSDRPRVLAQAADVLGRHGISIASAIQKEGPDDGFVPVVMLTHEADETACAAALREIDAMDVVGAPTVRLRIEG